MSYIIWHEFPHEKPCFGDLILWSHCQAPSKPPDIIVFDRDTEWIDGDGWAKINDEPKRKPLPDGRLPMTSEELLEFNQLIELTEIKKVFIKNGFIYYTFFDLDIILSDVKAIIYLATLFDLEV